MQRRGAKGAVRTVMNRKMAGKMKGMPAAVRHMNKQMQRDMQQRGLGGMQSLQMLVGYWDPVLDDKPWSTIGLLSWLFKRRVGGAPHADMRVLYSACAPRVPRNWQLLSEEMWRAAAIEGLVRGALPQKDADMLALFRQLYVDVNRNAADGSADSSICTQMVSDAIRNEMDTRLHKGMAKFDWHLHQALGPSDSRILQRRLFSGGPGGAQSAPFFQVMVQFQTLEIEKGFDRSGKLIFGSNDPIRRSQVWVFERVLSQEGRWRVCARLGERGVKLLRGREVDSQKPPESFKNRMAALWEAQKLGIKSEPTLQGLFAKATLPSGAKAELSTKDAS